MKKSIFFLAVSIFSLFTKAQLPNINLVQVATGFNKPLDLKNCGDNRLFVVEQAGKIRILSKSGVINATPFLTLDSVRSTGNEQGLLSLAFSPNYKQDGFFYVNYIFNNGTSPGATRISRFSVNSVDSNLADASSEKVLLTFNQPETNHNGATLMFGKDGYLYDSQGDGGGANDQHGTYGNGQNKNTLLAKMLRLDVSNPDTSYTVPATNPFVGVANTKPEIWAYGLRNPWRCSFDRVTGDMWIGDVGQNAWEEIDFQEVSSVGGENYGWRCREGLHAFNTTGCVSTGFTEPVFEYSHSYQSSCSLTGGYIYRGTQHSALWGRYLFTDYCSGIIFSLKQTATNVFDADTLNNLTDFQYTSFGEDNNGEIYVCYQGSTTTNGRIYRLTETTNCNPVAFISLNDTVESCKPATVSALRGDTLSYQWYDVNGLINGANSYDFATQQSGWYKVKVSKTANANCHTMSDSVYVNVRDTTALALCNCINPLCNNTIGTQALAGYVSPASGIYSGTNVANNQFTTLNQSAGNYNIAYAYTNQYGCQSHTSFALTVNDTSALTVISINNKYCADDSAVSLSGIVQPLGGIYYSGSVTNDSIFNPAVAGVGVADVPYAYTDNNNCQSIVYVALEVGAATVLTSTITANDYCIDANDFPMVGFVTPTGGVYSGNGVSGNTFSPAAAGVGAATVYYDYTNSFGCASRDTIGWNVMACTGINELKSELGFSIFPNPTKGNFSLNVRVNSAQQAEITITDVVGKVCYRKQQLLEPNKPIVAVDVPQLARGTYTVQLKAEKESAVKSLVVE